MEQQIKRRHVIMAPHADDELIGCFSILETKEVQSVLVVNDAVKTEMLACQNHYGFDVHLVDERSVYNYAVFARELGGNIYFPDPIYEWHPAHRFWGAQGEKCLRGGQSNVVFYSINMTAPYVHEMGVIGSENKKSKLDALYIQKKELWKYDYKYFLFEGHCQWLMK